MYKILQELINNTLKHAEASVIEIQLNAHTDMINLLFEDNGKGFVHNEKAEGIGLKNIDERVTTTPGTSPCKAKAALDVPFPPITSSPFT